MTRIALAALLFCLAANAGAAPRQADPCGVAGADESFRACRKEQYEASEKRLHETYDKLHNNDARNQPNRAALLVSAQAAWTVYRDAECRVQTEESASGTMGDVYLLACLIEMNVERTAALQKMLDNP